MSDLISRADALGAVQDHFNDDGFKGYDDGQKMMDRINALPSADALLKQEIEFHKKVSRIEAEKVVDLEHKLADRPITSGYIADDKDVPPYTTTSAVSADRPIAQGFKGGKIPPKINEINIKVSDRPSGEWVMFDGLYCSNCHYKLQTTGIPTYCPWCGARMENKE